MNKIIRLALKGAIRSFIGSDWWDKVRDTVTKLGSEDIPGEEKHALAVAFLQESGWQAASWLLNLAIEVAVALLMAEADKLDKKDKPAEETEV